MKKLNINFSSFIGEKCVPVSDPDNGKVRSLGDGTSVGTQLQFTCDKGYRRRGPSSIRCLNGQDGPVWSSRPPVCEGRTHVRVFLQLYLYR